MDRTGAVRRQDIIKAHWLPNGDLRFYRDDARMGGTGVSLQPSKEPSSHHRYGSC